MGYERIRIVPSMAPSGCFWRYAIVPSSCVSQSHGARLGHSSYSPPYPEGSIGSDVVTGVFGDTGEESPKELAEIVLKAFPALKIEGKGEDQEYASWYRNMLQLSAPDGTIYAFADYPLPDDSIPFFYYEKRNCTVKIPLPPPGQCPS